MQASPLKAMQLQFMPALSIADDSAYLSSAPTARVAASASPGAGKSAYSMDDMKALWREQYPKLDIDSLPAEITSVGPNSGLENWMLQMYLNPIRYGGTETEYTPTGVDDAVPARTYLKDGKTYYKAGEQEWKYPLQVRAIDWNAAGSDPNKQTIMDVTNMISDKGAWLGGRTGLVAPERAVEVPNAPFGTHLGGGIAASDFATKWMPAAITAGIGYATGQAAGALGLGSIGAGATSGAVQSAISGGDVLKGALTGGVGGALGDLGGIAKGLGAGASTISAAKSASDMYKLYNIGRAVASGNPVQGALGAYRGYTMMKGLS